MMIRKQAAHVLGPVLGVGLALVTTGCDYWPPALQAQIEQLRSEAQTLTIEKTQLQAQVNELSKAKQDMQAQVEELNRVNREKSSMITSLQHQVDSLRAKAVKTVAHAKSTAKTAVKPVAKQSAKKKSPAKR